MNSGSKVAGVAGGIVCAVGAAIIEAALIDTIHYALVLFAGVIGGAICAAAFSGTKDTPAPPAA
jgi:hypothetical protein